MYRTVPDQTEQFTDWPGFILVAKDQNFDLPILKDKQSTCMSLFIVLYA
jgi:hypothetical protein